MFPFELEKQNEDKQNFNGNATYREKAETSAKESFSKDIYFLHVNIQLYDIFVIATNSINVPLFLVIVHTYTSISPI